MLYALIASLPNTLVLSPAAPRPQVCDVSACPFLCFFSGDLLVVAFELISFFLHHHYFCSARSYGEAGRLLCYLSQPFCFPRSFDLKTFFPDMFGNKSWWCVAGVVAGYDVSNKGNVQGEEGGDISC